MATKYLFNLQTALYEALTGGSPSIAHGRVYDDVPQNAAFPYVHIRSTQVIPDDTSGPDTGVSSFIDIDVWSRERGNRQALELMDEIKAALHLVTLTVAGRTSAHCWVQDMRLLLDPDGVTRHGIVTIEVKHRS